MYTVFACTTVRPIVRPLKSTYSRLPNFRFRVSRPNDDQNTIVISHSYKVVQRAIRALYVTHHDKYTVSLAHFTKNRISSNKYKIQLKNTTYSPFYTDGKDEKRPIGDSFTVKLIMVHVGLFFKMRKRYRLRREKRFFFFSANERGYSR